jgi:hypothetical protein
MWNPKTGGIHESQDVIWLKRMYYDKSKNEDEISPMERLMDLTTNSKQAKKLGRAMAIQIQRLKPKSLKRKKKSPKKKTRQLKRKNQQLLQGLGELLSQDRD